MAKPPQPTLAEHLFERLTAPRCRRSRKGEKCPACASPKKGGEALCFPCQAFLSDELRQKLKRSEIGLGFEQALLSALLKLGAEQFCE